MKSMTMWLILLLATYVECDLVVYLPSCAVSKFNGPILYTQSNFGYVPYGETLIGSVYVPVKEQLCSIDGEPLLKKDEHAVKKFLLIKRGGGCKFTEKVINAQKLGADTAIIFDHNPTQRPMIIMKNDGHGHLTQISSIFISNKDGERLKSALTSCKDASVLLKLSFPIYQSQKAQVVFWLDASHRETYILARDFYNNDYYRVLKDHMSLTLMYRMVNFCEDFFCHDENCVGTKLDMFCLNVNKPLDTSIPFVSGKMLIEEQLREFYLNMAVNETDPTLWWKYMIEFDDRVCLETKDIKGCSIEAMEAVGVTKDQISSVDLFVAQTLKNASMSLPTVLSLWVIEAAEFGIFFYPEATINNRNFYGLFNAPEVFEMICHSLLSQPKQCYSFSRSKQTGEITLQSNSIWQTVLLIMLLMTCGFVLALFIYTVVIRKEVNQQLSVQVNKVVESYISMNDSRRGVEGDGKS